MTTTVYLSWGEGEQDSYALEMESVPRVGDMVRFETDRVIEGEVESVTWDIKIMDNGEAMTVAGVYLQ